MITQFNVSEDKRKVSWSNNGQPVALTYEYPVEANQVTQFDEVIVQSDVRENGAKNLTIYRADGTIKAQPDMPVLKHSVQGVYAVWFVPNERYVTVILLTEEFSPYDTACTFDLEKHTFSKFHPSR